MVGNMNYLNNATFLNIFMEQSVKNNKKRINNKQFTMILDSPAPMYKYLPCLHTLTGCN